MIEKILTPFQKFDKIESLSGILLFCATIIALVWANSPWGHYYTSLLQHKIGFSSASFELNKPLLLWVNDGLMAVFFFLIGLEIKREVLIGELNSPRKAAFPFIAAVGGMAVPVLFYLALNRNPEASGGWGVSMATDIAFSLAVLKLLGTRVPISLKVFLTAFAIVDDLGAVLVIAVVYSGGIDWNLLLFAVLPLVVLFYLSARRIYSKYLLVLGGAVSWLFFLKAGIHPTIAGVLLAFSVPIRQRTDTLTFTARLSEIVQKIKDARNPSSPILSKAQIAEIDNLEDWTDKVQSPLQHLEHRLHNWVAYYIMPLFALFNAGIVFSASMEMDLHLASHIAISLFAGKCVGITLFAWIGIRSGLAELPPDIKFSQVIGVGALAGVGFTMSIFIANLAFGNPALVDSSKVGILAGSLFSGLAGYVILRMAGRK